MPEDQAKKENGKKKSTHFSQALGIKGEGPGRVGKRVKQHDKWYLYNKLRQTAFQVVPEMTLIVPPAD